MKYFRIIAVLCFVVCSMPALGQTQLAKAADSFIGRLRAGGQSYMVPNVRIGQEALSAGLRSRIGFTQPTFKETLQYKAYNFLAPRLNEVKLQSLVERRVLQEPFPAYYTHFEKQWNYAQEKTGVRLRTLEVILEAAYGEETEFEGSFVSTYREVLISLQEEHDGFTAQGALKQAFLQARQKRSGFFVITVHETAEHGHDVLLLDLGKIEFISVGKSVGAVWVQPTVSEK